jgi:hypothetical protein
MIRFSCARSCEYAGERCKDGKFGQTTHALRLSEHRQNCQRESLGHSKALIFASCWPPIRGNNRHSRIEQELDDKPGNGVTLGARWITLTAISAHVAKLPSGSD